MNLLLVDDHELFLDGLKLIFNKNNDNDQIFSAKSSEEALAILETNVVDFILADLNMPEINGIDFIVKCHKQGHLIPFAIISAEVNRFSVDKAMQLGASGFISKSSSGDRLINAINAMLAGEIIEPEYSDISYDEGVEITERQRLIISLMADGLSNKEIAKDLAISPETVKSHIKIIFKKMQVDSRATCIKKAIKDRII
jgi:DNA-binding NarL/FixJ family response regulator